MKKIVLLLTVVFSFIFFTNAKAEEYEEILNSASLQVTDLITNLRDYYGYHVDMEDALHESFVLTNKTFFPVKVKMKITCISIVPEHTFTCCFGICAELPECGEEMSRTLELGPNASTNPEDESYISANTNDIPGQDTFLIQIYRLNNDVIDETDFVQFKMIWDFNETSIKMLNEDIVDTYPNPVKNQLNINLNGKNYDNLEIYDFAGKLVLSQKINSIENAFINTEKLITGSYLGYFVKDSRKVSAFKFVKE